MCVNRAHGAGDAPLEPVYIVAPVLEGGACSWGPLANARVSFQGRRLQGLCQALRPGPDVCLVREAFCWRPCAVIPRLLGRPIEIAREAPPGSANSYDVEAISVASCLDGPLRGTVKVSAAEGGGS